MTDSSEQAKVIHAAGLKKVKETPEPPGQKFHVGEFVIIDEDLGPTMAYFQSGVPAMVEHTYAHAYWGDDCKSYSLLIRDHDRDGRVIWHSVAWYYEHQLTPVEDVALIKQFMNEIGDKK